MKKYFLVLLLVSVAHADDNNIDITPILEKYAAANPVQPLPEVIVPIEDDIPKSKQGKATIRKTKGKCTEAVAIMEVCKSPLQLKYERFRATLKAKADAKRKQVLEKGKK
jgi:hypothetical protein